MALASRCFLARKANFTMQWILIFLCFASQGHSGSSSTMVRERATQDSIPRTESQLKDTDEFMFREDHAATAHGSTEEQDTWEDGNCEQLIATKQTRKAKLEATKAMLLEHE